MDTQSTATNGTPEAVFDALFAEHFNTIRRYAKRRLPDSTAAEDVAAETFVAAWQRIREGHDTPLPWLFTVASRRIADLYRKRERWIGVETALLRAIEEPPSSAHPLEVMAAHEVLAELSDQQREAVLLHYWEGLTSAEIGTVLGLNDQAVRTMLSRARGRMRELLSDSEIPSQHALEGKQS